MHPPASRQATEQDLLDLCAGRWAPGRLPASDAPCPALNELLRQDYRVVRLDGPAPLPADLPLSPAFLAAARQGAAGISAALAARLGHWPGGTAETANRSAEIGLGVPRRAKPSLNPFTGEAGWASHSLGRELFLLRHGDAFCILSQASEPTVAEQETAWLLPQHRLLLLVHDGLDEGFHQHLLADALARCLCRAEAVARYLAAPVRGVALCDLPCPHLGHNLWNLQSGWANALAAIPPGARPDRCLYFSGQDFYGPPDALFPECVSPAMAVPVADDDAVLDHMLAEGLLLFSVRDRFITTDLARRVTQHAAAICAPAFLAAALGFRARHGLVVLLTIRLENRAWLEQAEGIPALCRALLDLVPDAGFILHGMARDAVRGWTNAWMSPAAEADLAARIMAALPADRVFNTVGGLFAESIVLAGLADCYVAPAGSGMALCKWLANRPGVAFSNRTVLDMARPEGWPVRVFDYCREGIIPSTYLPPDAVEDAEEARHGFATRANFSLDWRHLLAALRPLLQRHFPDKVPPHAGHHPA